MSARDELARVIVEAYGEGNEECPCSQDLQVADMILAAGYVKLPEPEIEWGVGSKWGRRASFNKLAAEQDIELHHRCGDEARLVKRAAAPKAGPWEEVE